MYTMRNFKSKKALKDALANGDKLKVYSPGPFPCPDNGHIVLEGPHYPEPHRWYAQAVIENGYIIKVK